MQYWLNKAEMSTVHNYVEIMKLYFIFILLVGLFVYTTSTEDPDLGVCMEGVEVVLVLVKPNLNHPSHVSLQDDVRKAHPVITLMFGFHVTDARTWRDLDTSATAPYLRKTVEIQPLGNYRSLI